MRSPDEVDALVVELSIDGSEIALAADGSELGRWDSTAVEIRQIDATSFEFIAEGDRLIFLPDDPAAFGIIPIAAEPDSSPGRRRGRKTKRSDERSESSTPPPPEELLRGAVDPKSKKVPKAEKLPKPPKIKKPPKAKKAPKAKKPPKAKKAPKAEKKPRPKRTGVWLRTLDTARRYDVLGLDRVPIDVELRGKEHEHTWDHRVAATSGAGKHVCTVCGKLRF
jgi:hypothetical protein